MKLGRWLLVVGLVVPASVAIADWPVARHDQYRTGMASGVSAIVSPGIYWRHYLGGAVSSNQAMPIEIEGQPSLIWVASGRLTAAEVSGQVRWSSENDGLVNLVAVADVNGDGRAEIVAQSVNRVFIYEVSSGERLWAESPTEMGTISGVRVADLDGDGAHEVFIQECGCCTVRTPETGVAYSFATGFASAQILWHLPYVVCGGARSLSVADFDGDGDLDLTLASATTLSIVDGRTGQIAASTPNLGSQLALSRCQPAEIDGSPGADLICALTTPQAPPGTGHRVFMLSYRDNPARLEQVWQTNIGALDADTGVPPEWIADIDGDGAIEIVASGLAADGSYVTVVLDALTGQLLHELPEQALGVLDGRDGRGGVFTHSAGEMHVWDMPRPPAQPSVRWQASARAPIRMHAWSRSALHPMTGQLLRSDLTGDGQPDLFTRETTGADVVVYDGATDTAIEVARWTPPHRGAVISAWMGSEGAISLASNDGRISNHATAFGAVRGSIRTRGYYDPASWTSLATSPVIGALTASAGDEIVVANSRRALQALDARGATNASPPRVLWERDNSTAPSIVAGLDAGQPAVACIASSTATSPPAQYVDVIDANGALRMRAEVGVGVTVFNDVLSGNLDGDGVPDLVVQWGRTDDTALRTSAFAGTDGHLLWTRVLDLGPNRNPSGPSLGDGNGDGIDDVYVHHYRTRVLSGVDGADLAVGGPTDAAYYMPTLDDLDNDGGLDVLLHGSHAALRALTADLTARWQIDSDDERPYPYAALAHCPSGKVLVAGSLAHPSQLRFVALEGTDATSTTIVLANGASFPSEAEANGQGGQLTSVYVHANLTGTGAPSAVVGSSDGWLYAVSPCTGALQFTLNFGVPVGGSAFGDVDGDGSDELIVSTADGYLYGIAHAPISAPSNVRDLDPSVPGDVDVDEIRARGAVAAAWDPVPGAIAYEVAIAADEGGYAHTPAWTSVAGTSIQLSPVALTEGERYVIAVRAISAEGPSPDVLSDGFVYMPDPPEGGDAGPEEPRTPPAGCCSTGRDATGSLIPMLLVTLVLRRPRRR